MAHDGLVGLPEPRLLFHPLEDQHIRVHGHPDGQDEARDGREGEGETEDGKDGDVDVQVQELCDDRVQAGAAVVQQHEYHDQADADDAGLDALVDRVLAE